MKLGEKVIKTKVSEMSFQEKKTENGKQGTKRGQGAWGEGWRKRIKFNLSSKMAYILKHYEQ